MKNEIRVSSIPLFRKKQLKRIEEYKNICYATFDDSRSAFTVTFDVGDGEKQDLTWMFGEKRHSPTAYISNVYED
jgi:hypothetical protein